MARQASRNDEDRVDADVLAPLGITGRQPFRRRRNPAQAILVKAPGGGVFAAALFDLDEGDDVAAFGDKVDLAPCDPDTPVEDAPAVEAQPPGGEGFRVAPPRFRRLPVQLWPPSSSARA